MLDLSGRMLDIWKSLQVVARLILYSAFLLALGRVRLSNEDGFVQLGAGTRILLRLALIRDSILKAVVLKSTLTVFYTSLFKLFLLELVLNLLDYVLIRGSLHSDGHLSGHHVRQVDVSLIVAARDAVDGRVVIRQRRLECYVGDHHLRVTRVLFHGGLWLLDGLWLGLCLLRHLFPSLFVLLLLFDLLLDLLLVDKEELLLDENPLVLVLDAH